MLGDQRSGTNIEAPMSTIEEGVENVLRRMGVGGSGDITIEVPVNIDGRTFARTIATYNQQEEQRRGGQFSNRRLPSYG